ncbi:cystatin-1-like [Apostichopus japonicus]|uniref:cystatin-1-like n=1 Tax=Stichopus japonicus TaxID=307972 RepID=UPI003AB1F40D
MMELKSVLIVGLLSIVATVPVMASMLGGYKTVDPSDGGVQRAVTFAVSEMNMKSPRAYHMKSTKIVDASVQVVSGKNYRVKFEVGVKQCQKNGPVPENLKDCELVEGNKKKICEVVVWEKLWLNWKKLTSSQCSDA